MKGGKKEASDEADIRVEKSECSKEDENTSCLICKTVVTTVVTVVAPTCGTLESFDNVYLTNRNVSLIAAIRDHQRRLPGGGRGPAGGRCPSCFSAKTEIRRRERAD